MPSKPKPSDPPPADPEEAKEAPVKPPRPNQSESFQQLVDIPCVYLQDRSIWSDFKRALNECGLIWNLSEWMTTIVYHGTEWNLIKDKGTDLDTYFPRGEKTVAGDGNISKTSSLGAKLVGLLDRPKNLGDFKASVLFCCLSTVEFEDERRLPARQKLWNWLVRSLRGNRPSPGPFHYLVDEVQMYDISYLFKRLVDVLEQITICSLDDELESIIKMDYKPQQQNIFSYLGDLKKAIKRLHDINERLPEAGRIVLPDSYIRSRLVRAARQVPIYKPVLDALLIAPIAKWSNMTSEDLYHQLEAVCANDQSVSSHLQYNQSPQSYESLSANSIQIQKKTDKEKKKEQCKNFLKGICSRDKCPYLHSSNQSAKPSLPADQSRRCYKCDSPDHWADKCKYNGKCTICDIVGHKETVCREKKKASKPRAMAAAHDGVPVRANVIIVSEQKMQAPEPQIPTSAFLVNSAPRPPPEGSVLESFWADTGATSSIHPNGRSAMSFSRVSLEIATASAGACMRSEGVGSMKLYTPDGNIFPGFDRVVFAKQAAHKLASVGDLCDAGMVCVFDKHGLSTYKDTDVNITGKIFTQDSRDKKTKLFPLSLYRKVSEKNIALNSIISFPLSDEKREEKKCEKITVEKLPLTVADVETLPLAMLSKSYIKEGLSEVERLHAKCGDVGIKYLKRAFPSLKIPLKYRCEFCIEGKIHKFGHPACKPGERTEYLPGVCIHSDHSGPYAMSYGGSRYSQLFLDRGSGYLWGSRMKKKTGHYDEAPKVFLDSAALSGRRVQIFHTDGDGVFSSKETADLLFNEKIRHEFSAPYDSNTNPFVERARRTIFEGVCTALLRAGAPASFWGEAEAHKIFTINNLPTMPDKDGNFVSRRNLLIGEKRPFNLERLMAFGTATTCYVPIERRRGGKHPAQRRSFKGVLLGYLENMPAYRIWDIEALTIRSVSYNFTICHEGYYPFRDKNDWPPECLSDPSSFSPVIDGVLSTVEWKKFNFDAEDTGEIFSMAPGLVVDRPLPPPVSAPLVDFRPPEISEEEKKHDFESDGPETGVLPSSQPGDPAPHPPGPTRLKDFLKNMLEKGEAVPSASVNSAANFSTIVPEKFPDQGGIFQKPLSIAPPATLREARLSPWWKFYEEAIQNEYDGHLESGTWEKILLKNVPPGKNILRGKWILDDKRGEDGKILKYKARFVAMGNFQKHLVDYDETFAGVVVAKSFRIMLSILNEDPLYEMEHWDVKMAFTQAYLDEEIFMYEPEGFETKGEKTVCRLLKSLYGLKYPGAP